MAKRPLLGPELIKGLQKTLFGKFLTVDTKPENVVSVTNEMYEQLVNAATIGVVNSLLNIEPSLLTPEMKKWVEKVRYSPIVNGGLTTGNKPVLEGLNIRLFDPMEIDADEDDTGD